VTFTEHPTFYEDFKQWATWGKALMDLHIAYIICFFPEGFFNNLDKIPTTPNSIQFENF
jgi:hypothetical protein